MSQIFASKKIEKKKKKKIDVTNHCGFCYYCCVSAVATTLITDL